MDNSEFNSFNVIGQWLREVTLEINPADFAGKEKEIALLQSQMPSHKSIYAVLRRLGEFGESFRERMIGILVNRCIQEALPPNMQKCLQSQNDLDAEDPLSAKEWFRNELTALIPESESEKMMSEFVPETERCKDRSICFADIRQYMADEKEKSLVVIESCTLDTLRQKVIRTMQKKEKNQSKSASLLEEIVYSELTESKTLRELLEIVRPAHVLCIIDREEAVSAIHFFADVVTNIHVSELTDERLQELDGEARQNFPGAKRNAGIKLELSARLHDWAIKYFDGTARD